MQTVILIAGKSIKYRCHNDKFSENQYARESLIIRIMCYYNGLRLQPGSIITLGGKS